MSTQLVAAAQYARLLVLAVPGKLYHIFDAVVRPFVSYFWVVCHDQVYYDFEVDVHAVDEGHEAMVKQGTEVR